MIATLLLTAILTITVPQEYIDISIEVGQAFEIQPELLQALAFRESTFNNEAINGNCIGAYQINPYWHYDRMDKHNVSDLTDIQGSMTVAADYLNELYELYGDIGTVLMRYNGDSNYYDYWYGQAEISDYANDIIALTEELIERREQKEAKEEIINCINSISEYKRLQYDILRDRDGREKK